MNDFLEYLSQRPVLIAIFLILVGIWVFESLRARAKFGRGEKLDRRSWIVIALTLGILAGASLIVIPREVEKARNAAERTMEMQRKRNEEIRRLQEEMTQPN